MVKGMQPKTVESRSSAVKRYHRVSGGFELQATHLLLVILLKGVPRAVVTWSQGTTSVMVYFVDTTSRCV